jgi:hypothetical protein
MLTLDDVGSEGVGQVGWRDNLLLDYGHAAIGSFDAICLFHSLTERCRSLTLPLLHAVPSAIARPKMNPASDTIRGASQAKQKRTCPAIHSYSERLHIKDVILVAWSNL